MKYPDYIQDLIQYFSKWPSVGPKTAERYVFYLLQQAPNKIIELADSLRRLPQETLYCQECRSLSKNQVCEICQDKNRDHQILCVVENIQDLHLIEKTGQFKGYYFVLGKLLNTIESIGPEQLPIKELHLAIKKRKANELLVALDFSLEGESTAMYLKKTFPDLKISRLARGLPSGSDLEYADELTLSNALKYKNDI